MKVIDLSRELPENPLVSWNDMSHHTGGRDPKSRVTRIEAPGLLVKNAKMLSDYDLAAFIAEGVLLDLTHKKPEETIDDEDLEAAEEGAGLAVREGEIVILQTGRDDMAPYSSAFPGLSDNGAEYLQFRQVAGVGVDTPSVDQTGQDFPVHRVLFEKGILVIENLCGLGGIPESRFRLIALPFRVIGSVSPVRVMAVFNETV